MPKVDVSFEETTIEDEDDGHEGQGVIATCSECEHTEQSFGQGPKSRIRCIMLMKENCPESAENFYVDDGSV